MINDIILIVFNGTLDLFNVLLSILFAPVDIVLGNVIPSYNTISSYIDSFFNFFYDKFLFVIGWLNIPTGVIDLLLGYIVFRVALFFGTLTIKYFLAWYRALKV